MDELAVGLPNVFVAFVVLFLLCVLWTGVWSIHRIRTWPPAFAAGDEMADLGLSKSWLVATIRGHAAT